MIAERCVHGLLAGITCGLCRIDRRERTGAWAPFLSGTCEIREHDDCRMWGCECACHRKEK